MNLKNKKELAARTLNVGKNRIVFLEEGLNEIKEAITKEDIRTLYRDGLILIKPIKGRKKIKKRGRKGPGKIKIKVKKRKQNYVRITRKLRRILKDLKKKGAIDKDLYYDTRKKIKMKMFKSASNLKEFLENIHKIKSKEKTKIRKKKKL